MIAGKLAGFLRESAGREFELGKFDCCHFLADWYIAATGREDPIPEFRDPATAAIETANLPRIVARMARRAGLPATNAPVPGDIGLLRNRPGKAVVGAIKTGKGWVALSRGKDGRTGLSLIVPGQGPGARLMAAWGLPNG